MTTDNVASSQTATEDNLSSQFPSATRVDRPPAQPPSTSPAPAAAATTSTATARVRSTTLHLSRQNRFVTIGVAVVCLVIGLVVTGAVVLRTNAESRDSLGQRALTASVVMNRAAVANLARLGAAGDFSTLAQSSDYATVRAQLQAIRSANQGCRFVYVLGEFAGRPVYLADAEAEASSAYSAPGETFSEVPSSLIEALRQGHTYVSPPAIDKYGMWVTAVAPIRDPGTGQVVAALGMDVDALDWMRKSVPSGLFTAAGSALILIVLVSVIRVRQKEIEGELLHYASHDFLTDLPNRYALEVFLEEAADKHTDGERTSVAIMDVDNFKMVNDSFTHSVGDKVLTNLVAIVNSRLRKQDFVARLGGDEFAIVFPRTPLEEAKEVAKSLREAVQSAPFSAGDQPLDLTVSIGVAEMTSAAGSSANPDIVLSRADMALFAAKRTGRNKVVAYDRGLPSQATQVDAQRVIPLVKAAISAGNLVIHLQPVVESISGDVTCFEVLTRIKDRDGSLIYPGVFLPVAEQYGLIAELDRKVVAAAIRLLEERPGLRLFANLSQSSVGDPEVLEYIRHSLSSTWVDPSRLGFEISEAVAVTDSSILASWVEAVRYLGCPLALDDFGSGYSSFLRLGNLPVDFLKIDGAFVRDMDTEASHKAFVQAMNDMAHAVGKKTVAEFVENDRIRAIVREMGVDYSQGYNLGKPAPAEEWEKK